MSNKKQHIIYWGATGLLSVMVIMSTGMYFFNNQMVSEVFVSLGYPTYLVYPLATAKLLGIIAILTKKSRCLKQLAYAGFFYCFLLGFGAHVMAGDGQFGGALVALVLLLLSYHYDKKLFSPRNN